MSSLAIAAPAWSDDRGRAGRPDHNGRDHDGRYSGHANQQRAVERQQRERWRDAREREHRAARAAWEREAARRHEIDRHRAAATWRFERGHGWRHYQAGVWSPVQVWWWIGGRALLRPVPAVRIVNYPTGRYELLGDGILVPFYWVWRPTVVVAAPPPIPGPPPPVVPAPPDYAYPPPPPPPPPVS